MVRWLAIVVAVWLLAVPQTSFAQQGGWVDAGDGLQFHCPSLVTALESIEAGRITGIAGMILVKSDNGTSTIGEYVGTAVIELVGAGQSQIDLGDILAVPISACSGDDGASNSTVTGSTAAESGGDSFTLVATANANLRSCPGTDCAIVGQVAAGDSLSGTAEEGDWYQVIHDGEAAYIASFLVRRGPDNLIPVGELYVDDATGCSIVIDVSRGDADVLFILAGERRYDIFVDLYRPNETVALQVAGQLDKTFTDTGDPYIHQYYPYYVGFPAGAYTIELTVGRATSRLAWEMTDRDTHRIYVMCE